MITLFLCQKLYPEKIPFDVGQCLGHGVDGEVYDIVNSPNKVVKFCVLHELDSNVNDQYSKTIVPILSLLVSNPIDILARVYTHEYLGTFQDGSLKFLLYYYTMEKLEKISDDEEKVFHTILSHEDRNKVKKFTTKEVQEILQGLSCGFDFDTEKIIDFYQSLKNSHIIHNDIHPRNIMKDKQGFFKMVDLDRLQLNGE